MAQAVFSIVLKKDADLEVVNPLHLRDKNENSVFAPVCSLESTGGRFRTSGDSGKPRSLDELEESVIETVRHTFRIFRKRSKNG